MHKKRHNSLKLRFDRLLSRSLWEQFLFLGVVLLVLFLLSWAFLNLSGCDWKDFAAKSNIPEWLLPLYLLIDTNAFNNLYINGVNGWAMFVSSMIYVIGLFIFNGIIIGMITNSIERRVERHKKGHIHYLKSGHYVIMGYDDMVPSIITHIFDKEKDAFILLMSAVDAETIREKLRMVFSEDLLKQIIINYGHRTSDDYYSDIHLETAAEVFVVGNQEKPTHDAVNVECVDSIWRYLSKQNEGTYPKRITCVFKDLDTYAAFKTTEIFKKVTDLGIEFVPYNFYAGWAKQVFVKRCHKDLDCPGKDIQYPTVYGKGITEEDTKYVHLVFVGTTNFAVAFAMEAAHVLHFPNYDKNGVKTRITFIDKNADKEKDEFIIRNRHFFEVQSYYYQNLSDTMDTGISCSVPASMFSGKDADFLDVEFEFIKGDVFSDRVQREISQWAKEHNEKQYLSVFLALADQRQNFVMGMNMPDEIYQNEVPVFIRQDRSDNFVSNLRETDKKICDDKKRNMYYVVKNGMVESKTLGGRYSNIYPFGMNETGYSGDEHSLRRAKLINYLYATANYEESKFQSILALDAMSEDQIWKEADEEWHKLSVALKWSNLYNAYAIRIKLASLRAMRGLDVDDESRDTWILTDEEVEILAKVEHNRWNVEKLLMGYRKPHRNEDKYEHPDYAGQLKKNKERYIHHDIRPSADLGPVKYLDYEFTRYIPWIMKMTEINT